MAKTPIEGELVRSLAVLLDENNLTEIEYESAGLRIRVARSPAPVSYSGAPAAYAAAPLAAAPAAAAPLAPVDDASHPGCVKSPMVGVTYLSPEPGATRFINLGDTVAEGQTLLLIEAMKTFNPIRSPKAGKIVRLLVTDGQPVEFGEPLLVIE